MTLLFQMLFMNQYFSIFTIRNMYSQCVSTFVILSEYKMTKLSILCAAVSKRKSNKAKNEKTMYCEQCIHFTANKQNDVQKHRQSRKYFNRSEYRWRYRFVHCVHCDAPIQIHVDALVNVEFLCSVYLFFQFDFVHFPIRVVVFKRKKRCSWFRCLAILHTWQMFFESNFDASSGFSSVFLFAFVTYYFIYAIYRLATQFWEKKNSWKSRKSLEHWRWALPGILRQNNTTHIVCAVCIVSKLSTNSGPSYYLFSRWVKRIRDSK